MSMRSSNGGGAGAAGTEDLPFRELARRLATPCWISDGEGQIIWVNDAWIAYTGADVEKIAADGLKGLHDRAVYGEVVRKWMSVKARGEADEMVFPLLGRDGNFRPFHTRVTPLRDREGKVSHWFGVNTDISAQSEAEARLLSSEEQLREVFERAGDGIFITDAAGRLVDANAAALVMGQYSRQELLAKSVWELIEPGEQGALAEARGRDDSLRDWKIRRKDGSLLDVEVSSRRLSDGRRLGVARDVSARRLAEQKEKQALTDQVSAQTRRASAAQLELQRANERLAHAQKMEALGQLTGGVAHDFNNLLMVMGGHAELLRGQVGDNPRLLRALDAIDTAARRGQALTRHLLTFARRQRLNPAPVSLASRAPGLRALLASSLGGGVSVEVDCPDDLWTVEVDVNEWELAVLNMAVNARDAMPAGGRLSITARNVTLPAGETEQDPHGDCVELTVTDTGVGIPADILPKVIDPFFTTKAVNKGTGLGLSQVYGFVRQSGGRMAVRSELGQGTTVEIHLPRTIAQPAEPAEPLPATSATRRLDILCVEDNPEVADVAAGLLEHLGHSTRMVGSASEAMRLLENGAAPDLVFSDIVMAGDMDGLALARQIRRAWPGLPVLLATGYSREAEAIGDEFPILAKPYHVAELSGALSAAMVGRG